MASNLIKLLTRKINELPSLPIVAQKILQTASHQSSTVNDLANIVMIDPSLTAKVLRVVNSSFYGLKSPVTTVTHAISLLGFDVIKNMVLGISIFEVLKVRAKDSALDHMALWKHSIACGMFSRAIVKMYVSQSRGQPGKPRFFQGDIHQMSMDIAEEAFIGALLHDIGKILLDQFFPDELRSIIKRASLNEEAIWDVEREIIGVPHTEVGAWLARTWRLPRIHRWCIRYHHLIPHKDSLMSKDRHMMAFIVEVSDFFVRLFDKGFSGNPWLQIFPEELWEFIGIKESDYEQILLSLKEEIKETMMVFGLEIDSGDSSLQEGERADRLKGLKILLCNMAPRFIDPLRMVLNSLELEWEYVAIGKDNNEKVRSFEPDILLIDLLDHCVNDESLIPMLRNIREEMTGPVMILEANDWKRLQSPLSGEGPVLGFSMLPSRSRLIQEIEKAISSNGRLIGRWGSRESGFNNVAVSSADNMAEKSRKNHDTSRGDHLQDLSPVKQMQTWLQGSWGNQNQETKKFYIGANQADQLLDVGHCVGGKYEIVEHLCRGGMADIYKVMIIGSDTLCAMKLLPFQSLRDKKMVERFRQEASKARRLKHPNITKIFDYCEDFGNHYLLMELATGWKTSEGQIALDVGNLPKPMDIAITVAIIKQACEGLDYMHNQGLIHRDFKPGNLLLFEEGRVKLSDFGIARSLDTTSQTMTGMLIGTPEYMSPEHGEGAKDLTPASDIYSLGVVMYEMLTGMSPFKRKTPLATIVAHLHEPVSSPQKMNPSIPDSLQNIIMKCLNKSGEKRFRTALELHQEIDKHFGDEDKL